ncbi:DUF4129 domain-containing protein [Streptomyces mayonensis]|uniref:DUF4129 domain-containing protein n=1 Tax=Streptomyces mayonensis TaxID=2750816 RepID=UPI0027E429D7|nr:DUF4129 domain-containing protein [Streptomyces sp. A108]
MPGAVLAAGAVGLLAVAALALRPAEVLLHSGQGPLGHWGVVAIASAVAWTLGAMLVVQGLRPRFGADRMSLPPVEERLRETAGPLLLATAGAIGVLTVVLHRFNRDSTTSVPAPDVSTVVPSPSDSSVPVPPPESDGAGSSFPLYVVVALLAAAVVVLVLVAVVRRLRRIGLRVPRLPGPAGTVPEDEDARLLLSAVRSGRRALADTGADARAAVIACYAAMEDALVASGVPRHASDSPADLLTRTAEAGLAPGPAAPRLAALFREARYSSHPMDGSHREAAADALEEIASLLQDDRAPVTDQERDQEREAGR